MGKVLLFVAVLLTATGVLGQQTNSGSEWPKNLLAEHVNNLKQNQERISKRYMVAVSWSQPFKFQKWTSARMLLGQYFDESQDVDFEFSLQDTISSEEGRRYQRARELLVKGDTTLNAATMDHGRQRVCHGSPYRSIRLAWELNGISFLSAS